MTEAEWLACSDAEAMRAFLQQRGAVSDRKFRLLACACCRLMWRHFEVDPRLSGGVEVAERFADGLATPESLQSSYQAVERALPEGSGDITVGEFDRLSVRERFGLWTGWSADALCDLDFWKPVEQLEQVVRHVAEAAADEEFGAGREAVPAAMAELFRDVVGHPFRPVPLASTHRTPTVVSLARAAYDERQLPGGDLAPDRLAVLADALEEAGAPDEMVAHLRSPGPHVRGCWALDLCLGLG